MRRTVSPRPQASVYIDNSGPVYDTLPRPFLPENSRPTTPRTSQEPTSMRRGVSPRPQASIYETAPRPRAVSPRPVDSRPTTPRTSQEPTSVRRAVSPRPQANSVYDSAPRPRAVSPRPYSHAPYVQSRSPRPQVRLVSPRKGGLERKIAPDVESIMRRGMRGLSDGGGSSVLHGGMYA